MAEEEEAPATTAGGEGGEGEGSEEVLVASFDELRRHGSKVQARVHGRYVSVFNLDGALHCIDAICYHAGGPLTVGDIEEIDGKVSAHSVTV